MTRDELIAVGAMAIMSHTPDGLCPLCHQDARDVVDAVEPLIRADERESIATGPISWLADYIRADLRAKVEALRAEEAGPFNTGPMNAEMIKDDYAAGKVNAYDRVLALIDGADR